MAEGRRVNTQSSQSLKASVFSDSFRTRSISKPATPPESKFSTPSQADSSGKKRRTADSATVIDRRKKSQCWVLLKRLLIHPDGTPFKKAFSPKVLDLETIQAMLLKGLYSRTQDFAEDIRATFSHAMESSSPRHELYKKARELNCVFESNWKSLEEKWAAESAKGKKNSKVPVFSQEKKNQKAKNERSKDSQHFDDTSKTDSAKGSVKKRKHEDFDDGTNSQFRQKRQKSHLGLSESDTDSSVGSVGTPSRDYLRFKFHGQAHSRNSASQRVFTMVISDSKLESEEASSFVGARPKYKFLDDLLTAEKSLFDFCEATKRKQEEDEDRIRAAEIKKEREASRLRLQEMRKSVDIDDNLQIYRELNQLCGHSLSYYSLKGFGLKLKADWDC